MAEGEMATVAIRDREVNAHRLTHPLRERRQRDYLRIAEWLKRLFNYGNSRHGTIVTDPTLFGERRRAGV